jgi:hypothetical protein
MARQRKIRVRGVRKDGPDVRRLGRAIIELAQAQAEADAAAHHRRPEQPNADSATDRPTEPRS